MQTNKITNLRRNIIINFLLLTILLITSKISAQNDTIFFDQNWKECSKKTALYYRIGPTKEIVPRCAFGPRKNQSYYTIKDYYINNNTLQFSGKSKDKDGKYLIGEAKWFNEDGSLAASENYSTQNNKTNFKIPEWPILYVDYKIATKSQFTAGLEFCLDCKNDNKLFLGAGYGITSYNDTYYGLPDLHLSYNAAYFLFIKGGVSDKHAYALTGISLFNMLDLGFGYSQQFNNDNFPVIKGFTFGATFRITNNQKVYSKLKIM